eukprot:scaffold160781_cov29-Tisochrysis_lutea.AAC.1
MRSRALAARGDGAAIGLALGASASPHARTTSLLPTEERAAGREGGGKARRRGRGRGGGRERRLGWDPDTRRETSTLQSTHLGLSL